MDRFVLVLRRSAPPNAAANRERRAYRPFDPVIGFGVPEDWKDYSFKLAFPGNRVVEAAVKNGKIEKIDIQNADRSLSD